MNFNGLFRGIMKFAGVALAIMAVIAVFVYGVGALFHSVYVSAALGAVVALGATYLFFCSAETCFKAAFAGAIGGFAATYLAPAGFLGALLGVIEGTVAFLFAFIFLVLFQPRDGAPTTEHKSWRKRKSDTAPTT